MQYAVDVTATSSAPPEVLFEHVAVAESWPVWTGLRAKAARVRPGIGTGNGVGSIRRVGIAREETVAYDPPKHYAYRLLAGLPADDYRADITFEPREGGGTAIRWQAQFAARFPGTGPLVRAFMNRMLGRFARGLAAHAEHCRPGCPAHRPA
ncbi:Polyketide cyclase / dehydrase and lipid transport [Thermomonospora echinospora]|uniref:Polyketide cyclase / dehydrase and lipid transport n=1 Tax=Thermomonospora echinospora TaxID=1992 RepID=A0A1H5ZDR5_9ACTN|nr:SRPBCC family protein [Thermomonospora echinospora]SEG34663.1 Polyketide cyclase / dehydrase and lipid transport [Thermomonospora echinospora]